MNSSRGVQGSHAAAAMIGASRQLKLQSSVHIKKWLPASSLVVGGTLPGIRANVKHIQSSKKTPVANLGEWLLSVLVEVGLLALWKSLDLVGPLFRLSEVHSCKVTTEGFPDGAAKICT